jgi:hypothetical protein
VHACGLWKKGRNSTGVVTEFIEQYKRKKDWKDYVGRMSS